MRHVKKSTKYWGKKEYNKSAINYIYWMKEELQKGSRLVKDLI